MTHNPNLLFVGERQSPKAAQIGATWQNGRMSAKNLHEALLACGIEPSECTFTNLWRTPGLGRPDAIADVRHERRVLGELKTLAAQGTTIIALGNLVSRCLTAHNVPHQRMVHPAARGGIRKTECYRAHVAEVLGHIGVEEVNG